MSDPSHWSAAPSHTKSHFVPGALLKRSKRYVCRLKLKLQVHFGFCLLCENAVLVSVAGGLIYLFDFLRDAILKHSQHELHARKQPGDVNPVSVYISFRPEIWK